MVGMVCTAQRTPRRRHRVEAAGMPRVAAGEALDGEPAAREHTEAHERLERVLRAGWIKAAARPEERAHGPLVQADQERGELAHCALTLFHSATRLSRSARPDSAPTRARTPTTRSSGGSSRWRRASRRHARRGWSA